MPLGSRRRVVATGPTYDPRQFNGSPLAGSVNFDAPPSPGGNTWQHFTIAAGDLAGGAVVRLEVPDAERVIVDEFDGIRLFMRLDNPTCSTTPGQYDLVHPGNAELDRCVPPFRNLYIVAAADPATDVEVWVEGGIFALRPT